MQYTRTYQSPIGILVIECNDTCLTAVSFSEKQSEHQSSHPLLLKAVEELAEYFCGNRKEFSLPLLIEGTSFQKQVYQALLTIGYGQTRSYEEIAQEIQHPKACRAVGMANNRNKLAILIPCHRVIGKSGSLVGYAGGLDKKEWLLSWEKAHC